MPTTQPIFGPRDFFLPPDDLELFRDHQWLERHDRQYHWRNQNYEHFDDFLAQLASRKRKAIRKERRTVKDHGLKIEWLSGSDIQEHHWDRFFSHFTWTRAAANGANPI